MINTMLSDTMYTKKRPIYTIYTKRDLYILYIQKENYIYESDTMYTKKRPIYTIYTKRELYIRTFLATHSKTVRIYTSLFVYIVYIVYI